MNAIVHRKFLLELHFQNMLKDRSPFSAQKRKRFSQFLIQTVFEGTNLPANIHKTLFQHKYNQKLRNIVINRHQSI